MEQEDVLDTEIIYPMLLIPKKCTPLESISDNSDNIFIDLNISSLDTEGNPINIYSGFCNVKILDSVDFNVKANQVVNDPVLDFDSSSQSIVPMNEPQGSQLHNQSQVWIDPDRSPNVYNNYDETESQEHYSVQTETRSITVEKHCTYITQNIYNYEESVRLQLDSDYEHKRIKQIQMEENDNDEPSEIQNHSLEEADMSVMDDEEYQCGVFLSQLPEEIIQENENKVREERRFNEMSCQNDALKQLMSSDIQSSSKQTKTILFLGHDSNRGQTIQKIAVNDPSLECNGNFALDECEVVVEDSDVPTHKKYQCEKCKQIFDQISTFKLHMVGNHNQASRQVKSPREYDSDSSGDIRYMCTECGKSMKSQEKFDLHCQGHGNPELECDICQKVFASKFTLRNHKQIHQRKHPCNYCLKSFAKKEELRMHEIRMHYLCIKCDIYFDRYKEFEAHCLSHSDNMLRNESSETELADSYADDVSENDIILPGVEDSLPTVIEYEEELDMDHDARNADTVINKVLSNKMFLQHCKSKRIKKSNKSCEVCMKQFERVGDLKRHLIEHVIRSTLAKTPVNGDGTLSFHCEVCQAESFTKIDKYKAHLREHAKLTIYKCTFCDKSFSDSSNFSKHKKIHGVAYLQCDLCQRKFNSKKMITRHMEYHNKHAPVQCDHCDKTFHFESMLNKHIRCTHTKEVLTRFRCRFCHKYLKSLKEKWDHEWSIHNVRKVIIDCLICGTKFRKYSELKKHCVNAHNMDIPPANKLFSPRNRNSRYRI